MAANVGTMVAYKDRPLEPSLAQKIRAGGNSTMLAGQARSIPYGSGT